MLRSRFEGKSLVVLSALVLAGTVSAARQACAGAPFAPSYRDDSVAVENRPRAPKPKPGDAPPSSSPKQSAPLDLPGARENVEVINERFPNGNVKIAREVIQDAAGNYLNHGVWQMWDEQGSLVAQGRYDHDQRTGEWTRWYRSATEAKLFARSPYTQFTPPFNSQAAFVDGKLTGAWVISDAKKRKVSQWQFVEGQRHGESTWWFANGRKMREVPYHYGDIEGELLEWDANGKVLTNEMFEQGRKLATKTEKYPNGKKKSEGTYLLGKLAEQSPDDWWSCTLQTFSRTGSDEKHGPWSSWSDDGKLAFEGAFEHDVQVGLTTWWHTNGEKAIEGRFAAGEQSGRWTWWHESGQKSIGGEFAAGVPIGQWSWYTEKGKIAQSLDMSNATDKIVESTTEPDPLPQAMRVPEGAKKLR